MIKLFRGTTPTLNFIFNYNLEDLNITNLYVTFSQNGETKLERTLGELEISKNKIRTSLSQEETLKFVADRTIYIQIRMKVDGNAYATNIIKTTLNDILKDGVI